MLLRTLLMFALRQRISLDGHLGSVKLAVWDLCNVLQVQSRLSIVIPMDLACKRDGYLARSLVGQVYESEAIGAEERLGPVAQGFAISALVLTPY